MIPPNIALLAWPLVAIWLFRTLPFERAIIWSVLGSYLFLPSSFAIDLPGVPPMDKQSLPSLVLLIVVAFSSQQRFQMLPANTIAKILLGLLLVGAVLTVQTNPDPVLIADRVLPGLTAYDAVSHTSRQLLLIVPFLVAAQYLGSTEAHREILKGVLAAGLVYSALMLFEVRMSPQLHNLVYGYFPHSFAQQYRWGGFRPVVFLQHGLWLAIFAMTTAIAAAALWRDSRNSGLKASPKSSQPPNKSPHYHYAAAYMTFVTFMCKSLGSIAYTVILLPLVLMLRARLQIAIAAILVSVALTYPMLRGADLVPTQTLLEWANAIDPDREESLRFRFENEDQLLAHAQKRSFFGWGLWSRNRVFNEDGRDIATTDGYWVIVIGVSGWAGYLAIFGLMGASILMIWWKSYRGRRQDITYATSGLCLILGINMIDLLPNASITPITWLIAGALTGYAGQPTQTILPEERGTQEHTPITRTILY